MGGGRASAGTAIVVALCAAAVASAASSTAPTAASLLPRAGELPGIEPAAAPTVFRSTAAWVKGADAGNAAATRRDAVALPKEGFIDGATQLDSGAAGGFATALVFTNPAGAREDTAYGYSSSLAGARSQKGYTIATFTVAGIPASQGFSADRSGTGGTTLLFAAGRCEVELFEGAPGLQASLGRAGVTLYRRVSRGCA